MTSGDLKEHENVLEMFRESGVSLSFADEFGYDNTLYRDVGYRGEEYYSHMLEDENGNKKREVVNEDTMMSVLKEKFPKAKSKQIKNYMTALKGYYTSSNPGEKLQNAVNCILCEYEMKGIKITNRMIEDLNRCIQNYHECYLRGQRTQTENDRSALKSGLKGDFASAKATSYPENTTGANLNSNVGDMINLLKGAERGR